MPFIGAAIRAAKGVTDKVVLGKELKRLKELEDKNVLELVSGEKQLSARIALKQLEHQERLSLGAKKPEHEKLEREIVELMAERIEEKRKELSGKHATQYDIANIMLLIQKMAYETSSDMEKVREKSDEGMLSLSRFRDHVKSSLDMQQRENQNKLGENLKQMRDGLAVAVGSMKKELETNLEAYRQETAAALNQMKADIEKQEKTVESSLDKFSKDMGDMNANLNMELTRLGNSTEDLGRELKREIASLNDQNTRLAGKMRLTFGILLASNGITLLLLVMFLLGVFK
jgi:hypothetical protein